MSSGIKKFVDYTSLTAFDINEYLMNQTVMVFASAAARTSAFTTAGVTITEGMVSYLLDTNATQYYDGSTWVSYLRDLATVSISGNLSVPADGKVIDSANANYFTPKDSFGNMYHKLTSGSFYVDANYYYFRNQATTNLMTIDTNGNSSTRGTATAYTATRSISLGIWSPDPNWGAVTSSNGYLLMGHPSDLNIYLRTQHNSNVNIGGNGNNTLVVSPGNVIVGSGATFGGMVGRNRGSYGGTSFRSDGITNSWDGIEFAAPTTQTFMVQNDNYSGMYRANSTWNWLWNYSTLTVPSDVRYKRDIKPLEMGLNFIKKLEPISYLKLTETPDDDPDTTEDGYYYGFSAQNVRAALDDCGETRDVKIHDVGGPNMGLVACTEDAVYDRQYLGVSEFIAPMVLAIKELSAQVEALEELVKGQ